ncbi:MAG: DNA-processing protein DprA [Candidatus Limnocylindrales bacterium]
MPLGEPARVAEREAWAVLAAVDGLGPIGFAALLSRYGDGQAILEDAARPGAMARLVATPPLERSDDRPLRRPIADNVASAIVDGVQAGARVLRRIHELDISIVTLDESAYPARLAGVALPPHVLFVTGSVAAISPERAVAVVGTRRATTAGRAIAARLAHALVAADAAVVSGLAYGIDGAAHEATVRAGGVTIAVIGGGHARMGPRGHARLADAILVGGGAIVSEHAPDLVPTQGTFPRRNRIISGLASATVVVEAPASSGALITASWALEQGRECYVVPGPLGAPASEGCLALLREFGGAVRVVAGIPQLIADLGFASPARTRSSRAAPSAEVAAAALGGLGSAERAVAYQVLAGRTTVDEVVASTDLSVAAVLATLALLERRGLVAGRHGRYRPSGSLLGVVPLPRVR